MTPPQRIISEPVHTAVCPCLAVGTLDGFCQLGDGDVDWPTVVTALKRAGYDGPVTYEGPGDPADVARRIDRILG